MGFSMNDLIPVRPNELTALTGCSPALWRQLTENPDRLGYFDRVDVLRGNQAVVEAVRAALPRLLDFGRPAGRKDVIAALVKMVPIYGVSDRSKAEWATFWDLYAEVLVGLPVRALEAGCAEYRAAPDSEWFPKPGPLKAICERHAAPIRAVVKMAERVAQPAGAAA